VSTLLAALARIGDTWDGTTTSIRAAPRQVRCALAVPRHRRAAVAAAILVLILYAVSIGDVAFSTTARWANAPLLQTAPENLPSTRAPYLFEPVLALHPGGHVVVFLSPLNLLLGGIVAALAGCNIAVADYVAQHNACRRRGYGRLLGAMPAFLLGFACCTPTLLLARGTGASAAIPWTSHGAPPCAVPLAPWVIRSGGRPHRIQKKEHEPERKRGPGPCWSRAPLG
jgi:hypothetical protein